MECLGSFIAGFLVGIAFTFCWSAICIGDDRYGGDE